MFAPLTVLTTLIWPRRSWTYWVAWAFVLSCAVELSQGLFLPARSAQFVDVVANTLGALAGAWAMSLAGGAWRAVRVRDRTAVPGR
jgi:glycopeptide antibiotics resistance protein